ncbi:MAG: hypothetical protein AB1758_35795, partial [Candidatus Eremiobacterota bacterium]
MNLSQIGGQGLQVASMFQSPAAVSGSGDFSTTAQPTGAQLLMVLDSAGQVRALTVSVPSPQGALAPLDVSADSTALAWIMMTPGLVTTDPAQAAALVAAIRGRPGYGALVDYLAARLPTASLNELRSDAQLTQMMADLIRELFPGRAQFRTQGEQNELIRDGMVSVSRGVPNPGSPNTPFVFSNEGWRFVNVIRQEILPSGQENITPFVPIRPDLEGSVQVEKNLLSGVNSFSIGNIATGAALSAGSATDRVNLSSPVLGSVNYWIYGPGTGLSSLVLGSDTLPSTIAEGDFGGSSFGMTGLFYILFPIIDFTTAGLSHLDPAKLTVNKDAVLKLAEQCWQVASGGVSVKQVQLAMNTGDFNNVASEWANLCVFLLQACMAILAAALEGTAVGIAAAISALILGGIGLILQVWNTAVGVTHWLSLPKIASVEVPVLSPPGLFPLGTGLTVHGVNNKGTVLYSSDEGLFLKKFGGAPTRLSPTASPSAALNNLDDLIFKDARTQDVVFRSRHGGILTFNPPIDCATDRREFLPVWLNDTVRAVGTYVTGDSRVEVWGNGDTDEKSFRTDTHSLFLTARL